MLSESLADLIAEIHVVDIGAGHFGEVPPYQSLLDLGLARLTGFEPDAREAEGLARKLGPRATVLPYAVGDGEEHTLHICPPGLGMTSLLEPDVDSLGFFNLFPEWGRVVKTAPCPTRRLDDLDEVAPIDFLKMDVQGSELPILTHGHEKLSACVVVQTEISFITLYRDQPPFGEIDGELRRQGFIPHRFTAIKPWSIHPTTRGGDPLAPFHQLLEADIVYIRDLIHPDSMTDVQLATLALIAHHTYDSPDLVARCLAELTSRGVVEEGTRMHYYEWLAAPGPDDRPADEAG